MSMRRRVCWRCVGRGVDECGGWGSGEGAGEGSGEVGVLRCRDRHDTSLMGALAQRGLDAAWAAREPCARGWFVVVWFVVG